MLGEWPLVKAAGILRRKEWCDEKSAIENLCACNYFCWVWFLWRRRGLVGREWRESCLLIRAARVGLYKSWEDSEREMGEIERDMIRANH